MSKSYKADELQDNRVFKPGLTISVVLMLSFIIGLGFVVFDIATNPDTIDETSNQAVLGEFKSSFDRYKTVETDLYSVEIPEDWIQINRPEILVNGGRFYPDRYIGVTGADNGRRLDIYHDELPDFAVEKILQIDASGSGVSVGRISPQCRNFTEPLKNPQDVPTSWEGRTFNCTMSTIGNEIAAVETDFASGVEIDGKKFSFVFADSGSSQNNEIFVRILQSFQVK